MLRGKLPRRINVTPQERNRLLKYGKFVGAAITELISIVTLRTFQRWLKDEKQAPSAASESNNVGRPKTDEEIRELILQMARDTPWGYSRIHGELKKLGIKVSRSTVANILHEAGIDPNPERKKGTWSEFIRQHAKTLWACDFFTKKVWTLTGLVDYYVLFFIHIDTRHVIVTGMTANPDAVWVAQQARDFVRTAKEQGKTTTHLIRDNDGKFTKEFDAILIEEGVETVKTAPKVPNQNAYAERWVLSLKSECLDHFIVFGEDHLRYLIGEYDEHYHVERCHQGVGNVPLQPAATEPVREGAVVCKERLGGLLKHYERQAA